MATVPASALVGATASGVSGATVAAGTPLADAMHGLALRTSAPLALPSPPAASIPRLLSIQSSVVFGYVGNKSSNFPLQLLGFDVDPIHTCQLSNHTGYAHCSGKKSSADELKAIVEGLRKNNFLAKYTQILTGYMASQDFLQETVELVREMKNITPGILFGQCAHMHTRILRHRHHLQR
jgi:hypothetical protein